jgi:predicted ATPase
MIESIEFKNFKALKDTTLPLSPFTLIIGPNGSGKSTAMQVLQTIGQQGSTDFNRILSAEIKQTPDAVSEVVINWAPPCKGTHTIATWNSQGRNFRTIPSSKANSLLIALSKILIYSFDAKAIATPALIQPHVQLSENGGNLAGVLDHLRDEEPEVFENLNKELGRLMPEFDRILFETPSEGKRSFLLRTRENHHKISMKDLSEGTLLALALLTLAYIPDLPPIICLEEPDKGIHPRLLRDVSDALNRLAYPENVGEKRQPVQVIATTHSPYFLDLYKDFPEQIVIANKVGQEVKFEKLSDRPHYEEIIQDASLGDAWYTGIFGGVPTHP